MRIGLKAKLSLPYVLIGLMVLGVFAYSYSFINNQLVYVVENRNTLDRIERNVLQISNYVQSGILTNDDLRFIQVASLSQETYALIGQLQLSYPEIARNLSDEYERYFVEMVGISSIFLENRTSEGTARLAEIELLRQEILTSLAHLDNQLTQLYDRLVAQLSNSIILVAILLILSILFVTFWLLPCTVLRPLRAPIVFAAEIAKGNLELLPLEHRAEDEVGTLVKSLNTMHLNLKEMIAGLVTISKETGVKVASNSQALSASSEEMSAAMEEVAASATEFASNAESLRGNAENMAEYGQEAATHAHNGWTKLEETLLQMQKTRDMMVALKETIDTLNSSSDKIGRIVEVIRTIADQTNLLALNAAIEAARAGDEGRGFSVVAEEVRKLAEQSAGAADQISVLIADTQAQVGHAVKNMNEGVQETETSFKSTQDTGDAMRQIIQNVEVISAKNQSVLHAAKQIDLGSQDIAASVQEQAATMQEVANLAEDLSMASDTLLQQIETFSVGS